VANLRLDLLRKAFSLGTLSDVSPIECTALNH
jgi:hypothetical protein